MHTAAPPPGYCLEPGEELREYMRRSLVLARGRSPTPRGAAVVAVGDYTLRSLIAEGVEPTLAIVDCATRREEVGCPRLPGYRVVRVYNPRGFIAWGAWSAISLGMVAGRTLLVVEGEEDLLAIPAILEAPPDSIIAYGIPWAGLNAIRAYEARPLAEYVARTSRIVECPSVLRLHGGREATAGYHVYPGLERMDPPIF